MRIDEIFSDEQQFLIEMPREDAIEAQRVLDSVFKRYMGLSFDMSYHFNKRTMDKGERSNTAGFKKEVQDKHGRDSDISKDELYTLFDKWINNKKYRGKVLGAKQFGREIEGIIRDMESKVNVVFKIAYQNKGEFPLFRIITLKRDTNFKSRRQGDVVFDV